MPRPFSPPSASLSLVARLLASYGLATPPARLRCLSTMRRFRTRNVRPPTTPSTRPHAMRYPNPKYARLRPALSSMPSYSLPYQSTAIPTTRTQLHRSMWGYFSGCPLLSTRLPLASQVADTPYRLRRIVQPFPPEAVLSPTTITKKVKDLLGNAAEGLSDKREGTFTASIPFALATRED
ncbi:hypothetical protein C8J57DRAFT_1601981 [Mycena rebaudengoi]|nr:hypothetical protein C8J57DRAFT_1601981 [Mycena rebaudengoi]